MPRLVTLRWEADPNASGGRRARAAFSYQAFVPDQIAEALVDLSGEAALAVSQAELAIQALNSGPTTGGLEALAPLLLRAESVASSRIEGLELSQRNLARALFDPAEAKGTARAVAANVRAMEAAIDRGTAEEPLAVEDILSIHRTLMEGIDDAIAGRIRSEQNWIGGRWSSPLEAEFVPPPPEEVEPLLRDLVLFLGREDLPAIVQAAIAHAQFETIHPFADGNGRVGRALIQVVLRRRGLAPRFVPPVSVVLATNREAYVRGLTAFRDGRTGEWCRSFAMACRAAADASARLGERIAGLQAEWRDRAGRPRRGSAADRLIALLPSQPIVSVATARATLGGSDESMRLALNELAERGVIRQITAGRYARAWAADELFDLLNAHERGLATPTRTEQPRRNAPRA
jgi:Fic family protein